MPQRIVKQRVIVYADGQRVEPQIGSTYDFTDDQYKQIMAINPDALAKPEVKEEEAPAPEPEAKPEAKAKAKPKAKPEGEGNPDGKSEEDDI